MDSISIIKREHRNLNAVLFTLEGLVNEIEKHGKSLDFTVFHGIAYYLDSFLDRYHHPKETDYLFPAVRTHCPDAAFEAFRDAVIEYVEFERKHARAEEQEVLPLAAANLTNSDWSRIDLVPAPYGLGPPLKDRD